MVKSLNLSHNRIMNIETKSDIRQISGNQTTDYLISTKTMFGIEELLDAIESILMKSIPIDEFIVPTRQRHIDLLLVAKTELQMAAESQNVPIEIRSEYLRVAQDALGRITGHSNVEDLLGVIFSEFCVGK